jgi:phenylalanyl-tRNA synthetase beta chain
MTLDKEERALTPEMLVIADSKKPVAIAGVMGGQNSQIDNETKAIILESANFEAINIRKTSQKLGLRTDASMRFEKSLDPNLAEVAMRRVSELIKEIVPEAKFIGAAMEDGSGQVPEAEMEIGIKKIQTKIGVEIKKEEIINILGRLGFGVKEKKENLLIKVPSWRGTGDVSITEDVVEEIARIYGYDRIKPEFPEVRMKQWTRENERPIINRIKDILSLGAGMQETLNYSFWPKKLVNDWGLAKEIDLIGLENPMSEDQTYLRLSLVPGLLKNISDNSRYYEEFRLYEVGRIFFGRKGKYRIEKHSKEHLPEQPYYLAGAAVCSGNKDLFLSVKGIVEKLGEEFGIDFLAWSAGRNPFYEVINKIVDKEKRLVIVNGKEKIGWIGEINMVTTDYFGIKNRRVAIFEMDLTSILEAKKRETKKYRSTPKYPAVERDIAIEIAWKARWENIKKEIERMNPLVEEITFLSEYDLGKKKSLAFRIKYQAPDRTLKDEEIEMVEKEIVRFLGEKFGATRR